MIAAPHSPPTSAAGRGRLWANVLKRPFDFAVALLGLLVCFPLFAVVAALVRVESRGPVFFTQVRYGRHGRHFLLYKFRSMTDVPRKSEQEVLSDNSEVTRMGRVIRRLKIDELPQLLNVLKGDMSLVGPRPGLPEQLDQLDEIGRRRLEVRPGLTGMAQVHGNIYLPWSERWRYDAEYVDNLTFRSDCWILARTLLVLVYGEGRFRPKDHS